MAEPSAHTTQLHGWLDRMRAGDSSARDELLRSLCGRLERLAHKMLRRFPGVRRWADAEDVLQNALVRLLRALETIRPASMREFFCLAATQMRRELLDLARHFYGPHGLGAHHASGIVEAGVVTTPEPSERAEDSHDLEQWCAFHKAVENLAVEEREVVGLIYYHGWDKKDVAELFGVTARTIQRRWQAALVTLHAVLEEGVPEP